MSLLASVDLNTINSDVNIYQVPLGKTAVITLNVCNRTNSNAKISIAISTTSLPTSANYIEFERDLSKPISFQRPGILLGSGQYISVRTNTAGISVNIFGLVKDA